MSQLYVLKFVVEVWPIIRTRYKKKYKLNYDNDRDLRRAKNLHGQFWTRSQNEERCYSSGHERGVRIKN